MHVIPSLRALGDLLVAPEQTRRNRLSLSVSHIKSPRYPWRPAPPPCHSVRTTITLGRLKIRTWCSNCRLGCVAHVNDPIDKTHGDISCSSGMVRWFEGWPLINETPQLLRKQPMIMVYSALFSAIMALHTSLAYCSHHLDSCGIDPWLGFKVMRRWWDCHSCSAGKWSRWTCHMWKPCTCDMPSGQCGLMPMVKHLRTLHAAERFLWVDCESGSKCHLVFRR